MQGIVERAQIGVDFFLQVAGQEAQPLARLDRRARQDDAVDLALQQMGHGDGHRQIGLAGARGPEAEHQVGLFKRAHIFGLHRRARRDRAFARAQRKTIVGIAIARRHAHRGLHVARRDLHAFLQARIQRTDRAVGNFARGDRAGYLEMVAAIAQLDVEQLLDLQQMFVMVAKQRRQQGVVVELDLTWRHADRLGGTQAPALSATSGAGLHCTDTASGASTPPRLWAKHESIVTSTRAPKLPPGAVTCTA